MAPLVKRRVPSNEEPSISETLVPVSTIFIENELRLTNMCQLESAYVSPRSKIKLPETDYTTHRGKDILKNRENWFMAQKDTKQHKTTDILGAFFSCTQDNIKRQSVIDVLRLCSENMFTLS